MAQPPPADDAPLAVSGRETGSGASRNAIDAALSHLRFYHLFNATVLALVAALALEAPQLTLLPLYLAVIARMPTRYLRENFGLRDGAAVLAVVALAFITLIATTLAIVLPVVLQALQIDANTIARAKPVIQELVDWSRQTLASMGVNVETLNQHVDLSPEGIVKFLADSARQGAGKLFGTLLQPVVLIGLSLLVVFMASYALGYSRSLKRESMRFLRTCWPARTVHIIERLVVHTQLLGAEVFRGYSWMVLVLGVFYFLVYLGAIALFSAAQSLPPLIVIALVVLSGVIGAIPGLGAKVLLLLGAVAGLVVGLAAAIFTGSIWLGVYIFAAIVIVTGFESKFGTPTTLGKALGVNSCLMLFLAIGTVAAYGFAATLWTIFVFLPILVAGMRVMRELYAAPPLTAEEADDFD